MVDRMTITDVEWKNQLTSEQYEICRRKGTEIPFSGEYVNSKDNGIYTCVCCGNELFSSDDKFDSGTGWPSFTQSIKPEKVDMQLDLNHGMQRTEVMCSKCGATWKSAVIKNPLSQYTWVLWTAGFTPPGKENYKIFVRATDKTGQVQTAEFNKPFPDGATGYQAVSV